MLTVQILQARGNISWCEPRAEDTENHQRDRVVWMCGNVSATFFLEACSLNGWLRGLNEQLRWGVEPLEVPGGCFQSAIFRDVLYVQSTVVIAWCRRGAFQVAPPTVVHTYVQGTIHTWILLCTCTVHALSKLPQLRECQSSGRLIAVISGLLLTSPQRGRKAGKYMLSTRARPSLKAPG